MSKKTELFNKAMSYYGLKETIDGVYNQEVMNILNNVSDLQIKKNLPWCAAFVNHILKECGYNYSRELTARNLLKIGRSVKEPKLGDIVVLWRGSKDSWRGHTGFFVSEVGNVIYILGGNQSNMVCIKAYSKKQLLSYRSIGIKK